ncbi:hypothetical protein NDU88_002025 [Pleurodeles waltl]|uniref:Uncharacterized protein n=1 Tax=Pleurodeles waltl TaxID=8319 RepID=A0AAV7M259_PLEWA|nr:hypothetical protein NDU88_002025 [Pleurodeles waltl]
MESLLLLGRDPRKGLEHLLKQCQDQLLDVLGHIAKILDMVEEAYLNDMPVDLELLSGRSQKAAMLLGNDNAGLLTERRKVKTEYYNDQKLNPVYFSEIDLI